MVETLQVGLEGQEVDLEGREVLEDREVLLAFRQMVGRVVGQADLVEDREELLEDSLLLEVQEVLEASAIPSLVVQAALAEAQAVQVEAQVALAVPSPEQAPPHSLLKLLSILQITKHFHYTSTYNH